MIGTLKDYKDWQKAWEDIVKQSEIQLEQASLILPVIKAKVFELEKEEEIKKNIE